MNRKTKRILTRVAAVLGVLFLVGLVSAGIAYLASDTFADGIDAFIDTFNK